jgi:hypothetical protein
MSNASVTMNGEANRTRAMEILYKRYQECDASPRGHLSPIDTKCVYCGRHLHYESETDSMRNHDLSAGLIKITMDIENGRLK